MRFSSSLLALTLAACSGPPNSLEGSISESFSLDFDRVALFRQGTTLRIEYLKDVAGTTSKVVKISLQTERLTLKDDSDVEGDLFLERVTIERVANSGGGFPPVVGGKLHFEEFSMEPNHNVDGDFECAFDNGRTLSGNFEGRIQDVPLD